MKLFGAYYRAYFSRFGLLPDAGCENSGRVFFWADSEERTLETGKAIAAGMFPGCRTSVGSLTLGHEDALFHPFKAGIKPPDSSLAFSAVSGRIGTNASGLGLLYHPALLTLEKVLLNCASNSPCPALGAGAKKSLLAGSTKLEPGKDGHLPRLIGPLHTGATLSEDLLLEYGNGMTGQKLGWGRVNESNLLQIMGLHNLYADLLRETPSIARARASNLLSHILRTLEQAIRGAPVAGALGKPADKVVVLVGHDTNLSNVAGALRLSWLIPGYQRGDTPPGGALVFELWRATATGEYSIRVHYICQTLQQMRTARPLTLDFPPARAPVFVPACSLGGQAMACPWRQFRVALQREIEPQFVAR